MLMDPFSGAPLQPSRLTQTPGFALALRGGTAAAWASSPTSQISFQIPDSAARPGHFPTVAVARHVLSPSLSFRLCKMGRKTSPRGVGVRTQGANTPEVPRKCFRSTRPGRAPRGSRSDPSVRWSAFWKPRRRSDARAFGRSPPPHRWSREGTHGSRSPGSRLTAACGVAGNRDPRGPKAPPDRPQKGSEDGGILLQTAGLPLVFKNSTDGNKQ